METLYLTCAIVGGTLLVCQFLLSMLGLGEHHDMGGHDFHDMGGHDAGVHDSHDGTDHSHDAGHEDQASWFVGILTVRTVVAAVTFFGLAGLAGTAEWGEQPITLVVAAATGAGALLLVGWVMRQMQKLKAEGTVRIDRAVGKSGTVYLSIPGQKAGVGKVLLNLQNRTAEYQAVTAEQELPTGVPIVVVAVINSDTVEVARGKTD